MLILSRVCADFYDQNRNLLHKIAPADLGFFHDAPESIRQDPLFQMLVDDKSIKFPEDALTNRALENDPYAGATAEGKEIKETKESKPRTTRSKSESKPEPKPEPKAETKSETKTDPAPAEQPAETKGK